MDRNLSWEDFSKIEMRVGTIVKAEVFKEAKKPAYKVWVDFGPLGILKSSAQLQVKYKAEDLPGKQVIGVVNFPKKQIANIQSECLILGALGAQGAVSLLQPDEQVENGLRIA